MSKDCLVVKGLKRWFGGDKDRVEVLRGIDVKFESGKTYAITGVSGTGKSTFLHLLAGIDTPSEGAVFFNGKSLIDLQPKEKEAFLSNSIGLVFQSPYLISELSVLENVMVPALISGKKSSVAEKKARDLLAAVGVADKMHVNPSCLSGGQQQRVAVARAVINEPAFLLADEPTGNLDIQNGKQIVDLFLDCNKKWGMGVIVASHDEYVAHSMDVVFSLAAGILNN